jgi:hypothetical protein
MATLRIHAGFLSLDNGARTPVNVYFDLAKLLGVPAETGQHYGDDRLTVDEDDLPVVEELLTDQRMLYLVEGRDQQWRNIRTEELARRLRVTSYVH